MKASTRAGDSIVLGQIAPTAELQSLPSGTASSLAGASVGRCRALALDNMGQVGRQPRNCDWVTRAMMPG